MTPAQVQTMLSRLAFRAAMTKAFKRDSLPDDVLEALLKHPEFDDIYAQISLSAPDSRSDRFAEQKHFEALAADTRVQQCIGDALARKKAAENGRRQAGDLWSLLLHEFKLGLRTRLRHFLNPPEVHHGGQVNQDMPVTAVPLAMVSAPRHPVLKGAALVLVSYAAYFVYHHPPDLKVSMIAPEKFPRVEMDSRRVTFDKVHFDDVSFQEPPELKVAKLRFGDPPTLPLGKVQFEKPQPFSVNPLTVAAGSKVELYTTNEAKIGLDLLHKPTFELQVKAPDPFKLQLDPPASTLQLKVTHSLEGLFGPHPQAIVTDRRRGFWNPTHTYTWQVKSLDESASRKPQDQTGTDQIGKKTASGGGSE